MSYEDHWMDAPSRPNEWKPGDPGEPQKPVPERVAAEIATARANWPAFNSAHEGLAVLLEEVDELKAHVWTNQKRRDLSAMQKEAIQVAAMAIRFAEEVCDEQNGRK